MIEGYFEYAGLNIEMKRIGGLKRARLGTRLVRIGQNYYTGHFWRAQLSCIERSISDFLYRKDPH